MKKITSILALTFLLITLLISPIPVQADGPVLYVSEFGIGDCSSWTNSCDLQTALDSALSGDEIWVKQGEYAPGPNRTDTFTLKDRVAIYGGFASDYTGSIREDRNWSASPAILIGKINETERVYHVVTATSGTTSTLDGVTIAYGHASSTTTDFYKYGGGIYNSAGKLTIANVIFFENYASRDGGGLYNSNDSESSLTNVSFEGNTADNGGGISNDTGSELVIDKAEFINNIAIMRGGGIYNNDSTTTITNAIFRQNEASTAGGGIYNRSEFLPGQLSVINATLFDNRVTETHGYDGGGIGTEIVGEGIAGSTTVINTILWGNSAKGDDPIKEQISEIDETDTTTVTYSIIQDGGWPDESNLAVDPLFIDAANGNLNVQGNSPAIDNGTNNNCPLEDIDGISRPQKGTSGNELCDMGAYEFVIPADFEKLSPQNNATGQPLSVTISWNPNSTPVAYYEYCYSSAPDSCNKWNLIDTNTSVTLKDLAPNYTYYWQVRANGVTEGDSGNWWSFKTAAGSACSWPSYTQPLTATFGDVPTNVGHWPWIERLANSTITAGCGAGNYCPFNEVVRAQMAIFLLRGRHCGSVYTPPAMGGSTGFNDVPLNASYAPWVKQLAAEGITAGCGSGNFCPLQAVNRAQMAIFLLRAKHGMAYSPPTVGTTTGFGDVPQDASYAPWVKQLAAEGITLGCGNGNFCPLQNVNRAQMATFLVRAFGLP
ncbi:MAG: S-layer homology domain-containing protein [Anaerolineales bacterium]|jgi:hypothetical protein|nr:S-layer homology domain-containing protein [Anaerolineales bacterium]